MHVTPSKMVSWGQVQVAVLPSLATIKVDPMPLQAANIHHGVNDNIAKMGFLGNAELCSVMSSKEYATVVLIPGLKD